MIFPLDDAVHKLHNMDFFFGDSSPYLEDRICPVCKSHESDVTDTSFVGCPNCYKVFRDACSRIAYRYHGRIEHFGRVPSKQITKSQKKKEIEELEKLMYECANRQDYEQAQILKRKVDALRSEL